MEVLWCFGTLRPSCLSSLQSLLCSSSTMSSAASRLLLVLSLFPLWQPLPYLCCSVLHTNAKRTIYVHERKKASIQQIPYGIWRSIFLKDQTDNIVVRTVLKCVFRAQKMIWGFRPDACLPLKSIHFNGLLELCINPAKVVLFRNILITASDSECIHIYTYV